MVLTTRIELLQQSDTHDEHSPESGDQSHRSSAEPADKDAKSGLKSQGKLPIWCVIGYFEVSKNVSATAGKGEREKTTEDQPHPSNRRVLLQSHCSFEACFLVIVPLYAVSSHYCTVD